jgi:Uma2 family endonuclease
MVAIETRMTAEQLLNAPDMGRCELLRGELIMMSPSGSLHGRLTAYFAGLLLDYLKEHATGEVFGAETGFLIARDPDSVRAPDVAFVAKARLPDPLPPGFFPGPPDLAVEVLSPGDRASEVNVKTRDWLAAGCQEVWNVDPETKTITVHRADGSISLLKVENVLESPVVLPGFRVPLGEIF